MNKHFLWSVFVTSLHPHFTRSKSHSWGGNAKKQEDLYNLLEVNSVMEELLLEGESRITAGLATSLGISGVITRPLPVSLSAVSGLYSLAKLPHTVFSYTTIFLHPCLKSLCLNYFVLCLHLNVLKK